MDGVRIGVEARGQGRPVVFIHGLTFDHALLHEASEPVFADGAVEARRLYLELPGHGAIPADPRAASAEGLVAALAAKIEALCEEPPILVGHSYGAYLALGLATQLSLAGLALITPVVEPDLGRRVVPPRRVARSESTLAYSAQADERATFEEIAVAQTAPVLAAYQRVVQPASDRTDREFLEAVRARYVLPLPIAAQLPLTLPTLILCGRDDHWVGYEDAITILRVLTDAQLVVVPGCGQLLPIEAPEAYRDALRAFLSRL